MLAGTSHVEASCLSFLLICPIKIISTVNLANTVTVWLVRKKKRKDEDRKGRIYPYEYVI